MANLKFYKMAGRPADAAVGSILFNTTTYAIEVYGNSGWEYFSGVVDASVAGEVLTITKRDGSTASVDFSVYATDEALEILAGRVTTLEGTVATQGGNITDLQGRMTTVEGKAATAEGQLAGLTETTVMAEIAKQVAAEAAIARKAESDLVARVEPLETASADYAERIEALETNMGEGGSVDSQIDAKIAAYNTNTVQPGLESKADKATYEAYVAANDERVAAAEEEIDDEVLRATAAEAGIQEQIGSGFSKDATVAAAVKSAQDAADAAQKTIDDFLTGEGVDPNKVDALKEIIAYMDTHGTQYQTVVNNLNTLNTDVATLKGDAETAGSVAKAVADAEGRINATIEENEETTAAALTELDGRVDALEAISAGTELSGIKGRLDVLEAEVNTNIPQDIADAKAGAEATAAADATSKANTAESNAKGYADGLIAAEVTRSNKYADDAVAVEAAKVSANTAAIAALEAKVDAGLAWVTFE